MPLHVVESADLFGLLELPFLFISVYFAFQVAVTLKGGAFGRGMQLLAWSFVVMAAGHLHMQIERYAGVNLFQSVLGTMGGDVIWIAALTLTWALAAYGFLAIYRSAKGL